MVGVNPNPNPMVKFPFRHLLPVVFVAFSTATVSAAPRITEFLASGNDGLEDASGETPDWIEIHNPDAEPVDLMGYALTDDEEVLDQWIFPEGTVLEGGAFLIVFAAGEASGSPVEGEWHANFALDGGGEYLALSDPSGQILSEFDYPEQLGSVSYGTFGEDLHYFQTPTPGEDNEEGVLGFVADTKFSIDRGFHDEPFELEVTTATKGAEIFYSLDGSDPAKGTLFSPAQKYTGPISIETTAVVRAMAKKTGWQSTNTDTHTYLFHDDVVKQPSDPEGFPDRWGRFNVDYEMDPEIVEPNADKMRDSLRSLPTVSFVGKTEDFFGSKGIYGNPESRGVEFERPISFEWIEGDGTPFFQVDCGARIQGGFFRQASATEKHSFRLLFKGEYGVGKLRRDIVRQPGVAEEFDTIVFRAGANDGYAWGAAGTTVQFTRDEFGRRLARAAGHPSPQGGFQHLYINGLYWGLYNLTERPNEDFSSTYLGGEPEEWDSVNSGEVKSGSLDAWRDYEDVAIAAETYEDWMALQGLNLDGSRNPDHEVYLDADHYADYMIINFWGGNWDWPNKNFWFGRRNGSESTGFKHYVWDFENTMGNNRSRSPLNMNAPRNTDWVGRPYNSLKDLLWFQIEWADRTQRLFFNGGPLAPKSLIERYRAMADEIEPAIYAETARWGDDNASSPHTIDEWRDERDWMLETYLPQRTDIVLEQFKDKGLFPDKAAPVLTQHGSDVESGFELAFVGSTSGLFYTMDGSDPYTFTESGGIEVNESALPYENPVLLEATTTVKARYFSESIFGSVTWSPLTEATFTLGSDQLLITELMYHPTPPTEAEIAAGWTASSLFEYLVVKNVGANEADLRGVRFAAGIDFDFTGSALERLAPGGQAILVRNRAAFESRYGTGLPVAGEYGERLDDSGETVRLVDAAGNVIHAFRYDDAEPWPTAADGEGASLVLSDPSTGSGSDKAASWGKGTPVQGEGGGGGTTGFAEWLVSHGLTDALGDDDGDAFLNLFEYVYGTNPRESDRGRGVEPLVLLAEASVPAFVYRRLDDPSGVTVQVEVSEDLETWAAIDAPQWDESAAPLGAGNPGISQVTLKPAGGLDRAARYIRLSVTVAD